MYESFFKFLQIGMSYVIENELSHELLISKKCVVIQETII